MFETSPLDERIDRVFVLINKLHAHEGRSDLCNITWDEDLRDGTSLGLTSYISDRSSPQAQSGTRDGIPLHCHLIVLEGSLLDGYTKVLSIPMSNCPSSLFVAKWSRKRSWIEGICSISNEVQQC